MRAVRPVGTCVDHVDVGGDEGGHVVGFYGEGFLTLVGEDGGLGVVVVVVVAAVEFCFDAFGLFSSFIIRQYHDMIHRSIM